MSGKAHNDDTPRETPLPAADAAALVAGITGIRKDVRTIKNDLLPPVTEAAREARDGVVRLEGRVTALERTPDGHPCEEKERQGAQDRAIATTSKLAWWIVGIFAVFVGSGVSFALATRGEVAETAVRVETHAKTLDAQAQRLEALRDAQDRDRNLILKEVRAIPEKINGEPARDDDDDVVVAKAVQRLKLSPTQRIELSKILSEPERDPLPAAPPEP